MDQARREFHNLQRDNKLQPLIDSERLNNKCLGSDRFQNPADVILFDSLLFDMGFRSIESNKCCLKHQSMMA